MSAEEIIKKLFGEIRPVGETNTDSERYNNLSNYEQVLILVTNELINCAEDKDDVRYSVNKIGKRAFNILKNNYEYTKDIVKEI